MRLSPLDIRQQQFNLRMFRGLDPQEVDAFLDDVADDFESVLKEVALLREQLAAHEERARGLQDAEKTLRDTLVTTQRLAEDMKGQARRDADLLMREAALRGEKLLEDARAEEARIRAEINALRRTRRALLEDVRATLGRYERLVAGELAEEPERDAGAGA